MNPPPNTFECKHCGETRTHGVPHDSERCAIIAHAISVVMASNGPDYSQSVGHIYTLARWLNIHPAPRTAQEKRLRADRERSLEMWIAHYRFIAKEA